MVSKLLLLGLLTVPGVPADPAPDAVAKNSAMIVLGGDPAQDRPKAFREESLTLPFAYAFVAQGSYSGLRLSFTTPDQDSDHYELELFIPSHAEFGIGHDRSTGSFGVRSPGTPFILRSEACADVVDRFGRPRPMMMKMIFWKRSGKNHWSPRSIDFDTCGIEVERLTVEDGRLAFSGRFECLSGKVGAAGRFDVEGGELGVSKVD